MVGHSQSQPHEWIKTNYSMLHEPICGTDGMRTCLFLCGLLPFCLAIFFQELGFAKVLQSGKGLGLYRKPRDESHLWKGEASLIIRSCLAKRSSSWQHGFGPFSKLGKVFLIASCFFWIFFSEVNYTQKTIENYQTPYCRTKH